jgi:next-to-BRCA1 protein 1
MGQISVSIENEVKPGDLIDIEVEFNAPTKPGSYIAYYKLQYGNKKSFGPKVWCDIQVNEAEDDLSRL